MPIIKSKVITKPPKIKASGPSQFNGQPAATTAAPKATVAPSSFTPGQLTPEALSQLAARRVKYSLATGRDDKGVASGLPGFIEQRRLGRVGDINAQRVVSERNRTEGLYGEDKNFAARGLGRSGLLGAARGRVEAAALDREGQFSRAEEAANLEARQANAEEDFSWANDRSAITQAGGAAAYQAWLDNNQNQGAQGAAPAAAKPALPTFAQWVASHPWAKTPAQKKLLKTNYDAMVARRAG